MTKRTPYIYLIAAESKDGFFAIKIGRTSKPENNRDHAGIKAATARMASMRTGCPLPLRLVGTIRADYLAGAFGWSHSPTHKDTSAQSGSYAERLLHTWLKDEHISGEWYCGEKTISLCEIVKPHNKKTEVQVLCDFVDFQRKGNCANWPILHTLKIPQLVAL